MMKSLAESERKHAKKSDSSQKSRRLENFTTPSLVESQQKDESGEKGDTGVAQDDVRDIELEKELENRICGHREKSGHRERWREGGKEQESKGPRYENDKYEEVRLKEEKAWHEKLKYEEVRLKEEKAWHEKLKDDGVFNDVSRHRDERSKVSRPSEDRAAKNESVSVSDGRAGQRKHDKDYEQIKEADWRRGERSFERTAQDDRQGEAMGNREELEGGRNKDVLGDAKERHGRASEVRHSENRSWHERSQEVKSKCEASTAKDTLFSTDKAKEKKPKLRYRDGKSGQNLRDEKEKIDKQRDEEAGYVKNKHDTRRDLDRADCPKHKDGLGLNGAAEDKGRKRSLREQVHDPKLSKVKTEEGGIQKQHDGTNMIERLKQEHHMENLWDNAKQADDAARHGKLLQGTEKEQDAWVSGERCSCETTKDDANRHSQRMKNKERQWGAGLQDGRGDNSKEIYNPPKHVWDLDERTRYGAYSTRKHGGDQGKDDQKQHNKLKDNNSIHIPAVVSDRSWDTKESSRKAHSDKSHLDDRIKNSRDMDGQLKSKGTFEPMDVRGSKGHGTRKAGWTGPEASTCTSQDQEIVLSGPRAKEASTCGKLPKTAYHMGTQGLVGKDFSRLRGRLVDEGGVLLREDNPFHEKSAQNMFEVSVNLSSSGGTRQPGDENLPLADHHGHHEEELRTWEPKLPYQELDDERRRPFSHDRIRDSLSPRGLLTCGDFMPSIDSSKRKQHNFSQGAGPMKRRWGDDALIEGSDWGNRLSTDGSAGRNHHLGPPGLLPPPPPCRPGIDNPTVMGVPTDFVEGYNSRESRWYGWKASARWLEMVGPGDTWTGFGRSHWNTHNPGHVQGPASSIFLPCFPQMGSGYLGVGQQFHVPQVSGSNGLRPPVNMGHGGRFLMGGDGGAAYPGHPSDHGPGMEWHSYHDGSEGHHLMHAWEGPGRYPDERQKFGHPEWNEFSHGFATRGLLEPWQGQPGDVSHESHSQREALYPGTLGGGPWENSEGNSQAVEYKKPETPEVSRVHKDFKAESHTGKDGNRQMKERKQMVLLHVDVCVKLVDADLYKEYLSSLPSRSEEEDERQSSAGCWCLSSLYRQ